jgi:hypothetical protein
MMTMMTTTMMMTRKKTTPAASDAPATCGSHGNAGSRRTPAFLRAFTSTGGPK